MPSFKKNDNYCLICFLGIAVFWNSCAGLQKKALPAEVPSTPPVALVKPKKAKVKIQNKEERVRDFLTGDLFLKANDSLMRGDFPVALFLFEKLVKLVPENKLVRKKYAVALIYNKRIEEAQVLLVSLFERDATGKVDQGIGLLLAGVYSVLKEIKKAQEVYRRILKDHPKNRESCIFLAKSYAANQEMSKAHKLLDKCQSNNPRIPLFSFYRAQLFIVERKYDKAHKLLNESLKIAPAFTRAILSKGVLYTQNQKFQKAIGLYKKHLSTYPYDEVVLERMVQTMFASNTRKGITEYAERLARLRPNNLNLKLQLGIIYTDRERYKDAIKVFKEILAANPDAESDKILYYLGSLYQKINGFEESIAYFSKVSSGSSLFHDSNLQVVELLRGIIKSQKSERAARKKAEKRLVSFLEKRGKKFETIRVDMAVLLANYYEERKNIKMAAEALLNVRGQKDYREAHDYYLASFYEKMKKYKKADKIVLNILKKNPNNAIALNYMGYAFLERGTNLDKAYQYLSKAVQLNPNNGHILDSLGWYYYKKGKFTTALQKLEKAWKLVKNDPVVAKHLAKVYTALNQRKLAERYYREALKLCRFDWEKAEILQALEQFKSDRVPAGK